MALTSEVIKKPKALRKQAGVFLEEELQKDKYGYHDTLLSELHLPSLSFHRLLC